MFLDLALSDIAQQALILSEFTTHYPTSEDFLLADKVSVWSVSRKINPER